jgi:hypothetical protein
VTGDLNILEESKGLMMSGIDAIGSDWSEDEKKVAEVAFRTAYEREVAALIRKVREKVTDTTNIEDIWHLSDYLNAKRHEIDGKYDYSYTALLFIFASLVKDGWLNLDELKGLSTEKLAKVAALTHM